MSSTATVTVLFCDCVASTERASLLGEAAADGFRRQFFSVLRGCVSDSGGSVVKNTGDGLMVVFERSAVDALRCSVLMHERIGSVDPDDPVQLRVGICLGEVVSEDDDWFGNAVVTAARLCSVAGAGQTFAPELVARLVGSRAQDLRFVPVGALSLKGLPDPVEVVEVVGMDAVASVTMAVGTPRDGPRRGRMSRWVPVGAVAVVTVIVASLLLVGRDGDERVGSATTSVVAGVTELAGVTGAVSRPVGYEPAYAPADCAAADLAVDPATECGILSVPQSRAEPDGELIDLFVRRRGAETTPDGGVPVIVLDLDESFATSSLPAGAPTYFLWLRGYLSHRCDELATVWRDTLVQRDDAPEVIEGRRAAAGACGNRLWNAGVRMDGFTLVDAADDIRDLALALGEPKVIVAAGGLTSPAAIHFARTNPGLVHAMLLTNPTPPGESTWADPAGTLARQFDQLAELCRSDTECDAEHGDLHSSYRARFQELATTPQLVSTTSLTGIGPYPVLVDGRRLTVALQTIMRDSSRLGLIPAAVTGADTTLVGSAAINDHVNTLFGPGAHAAASLSWRCPYDWPLNRTAEISDAQLPEFAGANDLSMVAACEAWSKSSLVEQLSRPFELDVPVLLVEGGFSVAGANRWAESMAASLPRATVLQMETLGEDILYTDTPCVRALRRDFVADPSGELDIAACERSTPPIEFNARS